MSDDKQMGPAICDHPNCQSLGIRHWPHDCPYRGQPRAILHMSMIDIVLMEWLMDNPGGDVDAIPSREFAERMMKKILAAADKRNAVKATPPTDREIADGHQCPICCWPVDSHDPERCKIGDCSRDVVGRRRHERALAAVRAEAERETVERSIDIAEQELLGLTNGGARNAVRAIIKRLKERRQRSMNMADTIDPKAYANDCGCGALAGTPCPHTPIRCAHEFWYGELSGPVGPWRTPPASIAEGLVRTCELCGFQQRAEMTWVVQRSAYGSQSHTAPTKEG